VQGKRPFWRVYVGQTVLEVNGALG